MQNKLIAAALLLLAGAGMPSPAADLTKVATVEGITEYRLSNGLQVLLFPDKSKPLVTVNCTVLVGSRHEGYGETGMAHLLEHMVFKGTPTHPDVPKALRDHGANFNGTTWVDRTNYFETMPASDANLEFGIHLEADRLVNSFVRRDDLVSEMTVVRNEFESGENDPERVLSQRILAAAYEWHNYGKSTIGNRSDIERVPIENLQAFYKKFYQPDNAVLVIAGQFDEAKALEYVTKHFGAISKPTRVLDATYTEEPAQDGERVVSLRRVGKVAAVGVAYHVVAGSHPDFPAVEVLDGVLTLEPAGRLYKALVDTHLAGKVQGVAFGWHDPGVFSAGATCEPANTEKVRAAMLRAIEELPTVPATAEEVARSKQTLLKMREQQMQNSGRVAVALSDWAAKGDWRLFFLHRDRLEKVTVDDVNRVAAKYLTANNHTVGVYYPSDKAERVEVAAAPPAKEQLKGYVGRKAMSEGEAFDPTPANLDSRTKVEKVRDVQIATLPRKTRGEAVTLQWVVRFGNEDSLKGKTTAAELLGEAMERGTTKMTRQQIEDTLDKLKASVSVRSAAGAVIVSVNAKRDTLGPVLEIVGDILRMPAFDAGEFDKLVREKREQAEKMLNEPQMLAMKALQRKLAPYPPADVRYVPTAEEDVDRLKKVTVVDVKALYAEQLGGQYGQVAVVGDFDPDKAAAAVRSALDGWDSKTPYARIARQVPADAKGGRETINTPDKANAVYAAGLVFPVNDSHPDYAALKVGSFLLGEGSLASRLANRVRQKDGLSYGVGSQMSARSLDPLGSLTMYAITNPDNMPKVDKAIAEEFARFLTDGVGLSELNEGKAAYIEQVKVGRANDRAIAGQIVENLTAGRTFAHAAALEKRIADLTPEDIAAAYKRHVDAAKLAVVEAGDFKK